MDYSPFLLSGPETIRYLGHTRFRILNGWRSAWPAALPSAESSPGIHLSRIAGRDPGQLSCHTRDEGLFQAR
jgi:hypothetical protein